MKLEPDLIRDVLLYAEELPFGENAMNVTPSDSEHLEKYSEEQIIYAIQRLGDGDGKLIRGYVKYASSEPYFWYIGSPTFAGHQYLDNIREPKVWDHVKKTAKTVGSVSLPILNQIAASYIKQLLGLQ